MYRCFLALLKGLLCVAVTCTATLAGHSAPDDAHSDDNTIVTSAKSGRWSAADTWMEGSVPQANSRVLIRESDTVLYDVSSDTPIRGITISGALVFATDRNTRLDVGMINIQSGNTYCETGFDCSQHSASASGSPHTRAHTPALAVGFSDQPIQPTVTSRIRLIAVPGMDSQSFPAIVCCGGRMDFHGAPMNRTWVKLAQPCEPGDTRILLAEPVRGWRPGDSMIVTGTVRQHKPSRTFQPSVLNSSQTEHRRIVAVSDTEVTLDEPLTFAHYADGTFCAEAANLSRNVIIESADPDKARGHTMYHSGSQGSISYAEFSHLGKEGVLGRYSLHFHLAGDSMRGSSVIGASIHDSGNRWLTIHGTNYLVVRDCVGYRSVGHGFFMEDGTEVFNVLDRNLAVQALIGKPLPKQILPFDRNDGSGFWWANSLNTLTRNVACDCDEYGYFFQAAKTADFDPELQIRQADGSHRKTDIRTLPFVRFEDNEAHCQRRHAFNLGGGVPFGEPNVGGVGPDARHPFIIRKFLVWNSHWALHPVSPSVILDQFRVHDADYAVWRPEYLRHSYRDLQFSKVPPQHHYAFVSGPPPASNSEFPAPLTPVDDLPPTTVVTHVSVTESGGLQIQGTTSDNGTVTAVQVNGRPAAAVSSNFAQWRIELDRPDSGLLTAFASDAAGNVEQTPHLLKTADKP